MNRLLNLPAALLVLAAAACGEPVERLAAVSGPADASATMSCDAEITRISPEGTLPVARTEVVTLEYTGNLFADSVKLRVMGPDGVVPAKVVLGAGVIELRPNTPLSPGSHVIEAEVCASYQVRFFEVGNLLRPLSEQAWAALAGRRFGLDLRYGAWLEPAALEGRELIVRTLLGGALVLEVLRAAEGELVVALLPGVLGADGSIDTDDNVVTAAAALTVNNPYARAHFDSVALSVDGRALRLRDGTLTLGLAEDGLADVRVSAEVDVRDFGAVRERDICDLLASYTDEGCVPCASDGAPSCFALTLEELASLR